MLFQVGQIAVKDPCSLYEAAHYILNLQFPKGRWGALRKDEYLVVEGALKTEIYNGNIEAFGIPYMSVYRKMIYTKSLERIVAPQGDDVGVFQFDFSQSRIRTSLKPERIDGAFKQDVERGYVYVVMSLEKVQSVFKKKIRPSSEPKENKPPKRKRKVTAGTNKITALSTSPFHDCIYHLYRLYKEEIEKRGLKVEPTWFRNKFLNTIQIPKNENVNIPSIATLRGWRTGFNKTIKNGRDSEGAYPYKLSETEVRSKFPYMFVSDIASAVADLVPSTKH